MIEDKSFGEYSPKRAWLKILSNILEKICYEYHKSQNLQGYSTRDNLSFKICKIRKSFSRKTFSD